MQRHALQLDESAKFKKIMKKSKNDEKLKIENFFEKLEKNVKSAKDELLLQIQLDF
jgi:hypothetical protein